MLLENLYGAIVGAIYQQPEPARTRFLEAAATGDVAIYRDDDGTIRVAVGGVMILETNVIALSRSADPSAN